MTTVLLIRHLLRMANLTVYGTPVSTYVRTVRLLLESIGIDYTLKSVDIFKGESQSAEYLAKTPLVKYPPWILMENYYTKRLPLPNI